MTPRIILLASVFIFTLSCQDELDGLYPDPLDPSGETFQSSLFVEIIDTSGVPISDAIIKIGNFYGVTDFNGFLFLNNISVASSSYITVEKEGFFHASRRFYPSTGKSQYIKIMMIPNERIAFFSSSSGSTLWVNGGVKIKFPADAYEFLNGDPYQGQVLVSAYSIPANDPDLSFKMPGDLVGLNMQGQLGALGSFGMITVEIRSSSGELLQIKNGSEVEMRMELPASVRDNAPHELPMWYFDELKGVWKEEGKAYLIENAYIAKVGHFSYWNYDAWFDIIKLSEQILYPDGTPANQILVCITISTLNTTKCDYTNADGIISGMVAANELLKMTIASPCGSPLYTSQIGPFSDSTMLPPVFISPPNQLTLTGRAIDCDNQPVTTGYSIITLENFQYYLPLDPETGSFSSTYFTCDSTELSIIVIDDDKLKHSAVHTYQYQSVINAGNINVCQDLTEFLTLDIEGVSNQIHFSKVNFFIAEGGYSFLSASELDTASRVHFSFIGTSIGNYQSEWAEIGIQLDTNEWIGTEDIEIQITYFGESGDYVKGAISGILYQNQQPLPVYPFTGQFSVLRK